MKKKLVEKIVKSGKTFKTFKNYRANKRLPNPNEAMEIVGSLSEIDSYLKLATVVFEFECYIDTGEVYEPYVVSYDSVYDYVDTTDFSGPEIYAMLQEHFMERNNREAWARLNAAYSTYIDHMIEGKVNDEDLDIDDIDRDDVEEEFPIDEWLDENYSDLEDVIKDFYFRNSVHGFEYWPRYMYNGETRDEEVENENDADEFLSNQFFTIAQRLEKIFDEPAYVEKSTAFKLAHPEAWFVESDASLSLNDSTAGDHLTPVEIITPHRSADDVLNELEKFRTKFFKQYDGETKSDSSIGCHTNISFSEDFKLDKVKLVLLSNSQIWAKKFGRENHRYAMPQLPDMIKSLSLIDTRKMSLTEFRDALESTIKMEKFRDINFVKNNVIEFRFPGNDYLGADYEKLKETLTWLLYTMTVAGTKSLFREEYLLRLTRLKKMNDENIVKETEVSNDAYRLLTRLQDTSFEDKKKTVQEFYKHFLVNLTNIDYKMAKQAVQLYIQNFGKSSVRTSKEEANRLAQSVDSEFGDRGEQMQLNLHPEKRETFKKLLVFMLTQI